MSIITSIRIIYIFNVSHQNYNDLSQPSAALSQYGIGEVAFLLSTGTIRELWMCSQLLYVIRALRSLIILRSRKLYIFYPQTVMTSLLIIRPGTVHFSALIKCLAKHEFHAKFFQPNILLYNTYINKKKKNFVLIPP